MPKRAREPFAFGGPDGLAVVVHPADVYADDHPYVVAHPTQFVDAVGNVIEAATAVEQMTAAPGEMRRGPGRPPKGTV